MPVIDKGKNEDFYPVRRAAKAIREKFSFTSEALALAPNLYVAWLDLMGAGHLMNTSVHKSANFLARLHLSVSYSSKKHSFKGRTLAINDGIYLISDRKEEIMCVVRDALASLALYFISVRAPHDKFLVRSGIAFGPVYFGTDIAAGFSKKAARQTPTLDQVAFGPPIISAYRSETRSPPFGVAIHESARSFSPTGTVPFRMTHWLWWQNHDGEIPNPKGFPPLTDTKDCLLAELRRYFDWMRSTVIFTEVTKEKIDAWEEACKQYFSLA